MLVNLIESRILQRDPLNTTDKTQVVPFRTGRFFLVPAGSQVHAAGRIPAIPALIQDVIPAPAVLLHAHHSTILAHGHLPPQFRRQPSPS